MKQTILFFLFLATANLAMAQLEFSPSPVVTSGVQASDEDIAGHATITNTGDVARNLTWTRNIVQLTENWQTAVCDKNQCWIPTVATKNFTLAPDEAGDMDVHVYPNDTEGSAIIEVTVTDQDDASVSLTNVYYFNEDPSSTLDVERVAVKIYPNPSQGLFTIRGGEQVARLEIFSLAGQPVRQFDFQDGRWYNISDLPRGTYLIRMIDRQAQTLTTKLFNKM
jgi:hypothetical protein